MFTGNPAEDALSTLAFTAMALGVRAASPTVPVAEIVFFRSAVALLRAVRLAGGDAAR